MKPLLQFTRVSPLVGPLTHRPVTGAVHAGEILMLSGPSGCGKTTLLRVLARLDAGTGEISLHGRLAHTCPPPYWRSRVCLVAQRPVPLPGTVHDNLLAGFKLAIRKGSPRPDTRNLQDALESCGIPAERLTQPARELSGGELARVALLRAMLPQPDVLLLDEPTAALDADTRVLALNTIRHWLSQGERAVVLVTHQPNDLDHLQSPITRLELTP